MRDAVVRERYPQPRSAILPCLWAVQDECGWLPPEGMLEVAEMLALPPSEVQAVSTFYSMYFTRPQGEHFVVVLNELTYLSNRRLSTSRTAGDGAEPIAACR